MNWFSWSLLSALFAAATAILAKTGLATTDSNTATAVRTSVILVLSWLIVISTTGFATMRQLSSRALIPLVLSGITTGLSWLCYFRALQVGPASKVAPIDKLSVVFVVPLAAIFLNEPVTLRVGLGIGLIATGAFVLASK
jgi:transporter family protein